MKSTAIVLIASGLTIAGCGSDVLRTPDPDDDTDTPQTPLVLQVSPADTSLIAGEEFRMRAAASGGETGDDEAPSVLWRSTSPAVATVDSGGLVRARAAGRTWIVGAHGSARDSAGLTVDTSQAAIEPDSVVALPFEAFRLTATRGAAESGVDWHSSDSTVAMPYSSGLISAREPGTATVEAVSTTDARHRDAVAVTVGGVINADISAGIEAFTHSGTRDIVSSAALAGVVDLHVVLRTPSGEYEVEVIVDDIVVTKVPAVGPGWPAIPLDTRLLSNGVHAVQLRVTQGPRVLVHTAGVPVTVGN